ncbi:PAS domain-containing protein [Aquibium sp. A9E412]|uniref:sensor histidine kinase n=1 Tax=Aquibium sp. A9E412 TaxID=2976767 RepID=UPI0025AFBDC8|nr:HWE histidine kinase domain-containing protein [Aquibium sp. A9E412]MDN2567711.1 PAS domain-containing protein [Aquibium sp. A9E412]
MTATTDLAAAIVQTMHQPVLVLDRDHAVVTANDAFLAHFQVTAAETMGKPLARLGNGQWDIRELRALLASLTGSEQSVRDYRVEHAFESLGRRSMLINARLLRQDSRSRVLLSIADVTMQEERESELVAQREFSDKLIDSVREALVVMDRDLRVTRVNETFRTAFGVGNAETVGRRIFELGNGQWNIAPLKKALAEVLPKEHSFDDYEVVHTFPGIGRRVMMLNARRLDHMPRILLAIRDETERRKHADSQKLMVGELQHRVKNILANVQAVASGTVRRSASLEAFERVFLQRLQSLARAQDLLTRQADGTASLRELVARELSAHGWEEDGRLALCGPPVVLSRRETQPVAMMLHELATNAVKYGAFARPGGHLTVSWERAADDPAWLEMEWSETGLDGITAPTTKGYGTQMIEGAARQMLSGETAVHFRPQGMLYRVRFPLELEAPGGRS